MFKKRLFLVTGLILSMVASSSLWAAQFARPDGTTTTGTWSPVNAGTHHDAINDADNADYVDSGAGNDSTLIVTLSNVVDPGGLNNNDHIIRYTCQATVGSKPKGGEGCDVALFQGGTQIATTVNNTASRGAFGTLSYTIPDASAITDYSNLEFRITSSSLAADESVQVGWAELELPDAAITAPTVTSPTFADVTDSTATLGGTMTTDNGTPVTDCGVEWGTTPTGPYPNSVSDGACAATVPFTTAVTGLPSSTTIYFRAWATNGVVGFSGESSFPTAAPASPPTVTTDAVTVFGQNSATMGGEVTADGGATVTARGVYWNTASPAEAGTQVQIGSGLGTFSQSVGGLPAGTQIFVKAYATNSAGESLGGEVNFTTLAGLATVATRAVENIQATSADLGGNVTNNGGAAVTERGVVWNTTNPPEAGGTVVPNGSGTGSFIATVGGLPTGTLVYFKAYAVNAEGTAYSDVQSFTPAGPPIVTATPATGILLNSATLGGNVTNDGGSTVIQRGIVWNTTSPAESGGTVVPIGSGTGAFSQTVGGLPAATNIFWKAYGTNSVATGYSAEESFTTLSEPTVQASALAFPTLAGRSMRITWVRGNGDGVIVVMRLQATAGAAPADGDDYTANTNFTLAPELPVNTENYVVYKGPGTSVTVTGLTMTTDYTVAVYEYAGTGGNTDYLLTPLLEATAQTTDYAVHNYDWGVDCNDCHNHGSFGATGTELKGICETCHNPSGPAVAKLEFDNHLTPNKNPAIDTVDCGMCHELHNLSATNTTESLNSVTLLTQHNKSFLRANVDKYVPNAATPAYLHTDDPTGAPDTAVTPERAVEGGNDTTARGYCQVCHTLTNYHRSSNTAGADQCHDGESGNCGPAETHCGNCHQHNNKFIGVGGSQTCIECHSGIQGSRPIITTQFGLASTHIPSGDTTATQPDCEVCHDQSTHPGGPVTGWDADDGVTSFAQPTIGAPPTNPAEGEAFEGHCMSCHDDGSADSLPASGSDQTQTSPFIGSAAPPVIDETAWNAPAGHNRSAAPIVSCVGGCHGSGHGSAENNLLAAIPDDPDITAKASEFCVECHKPAGYSTIDVRSDFDPSIGTDFRSSGGGGAPVNSRHDIFTADLAYSGASLTCADCHSPHKDSASAPVHNPDTGNALAEYDPAVHGGGADPTFGVPQPDYVEYCLACHDGTPAGSSATSAGLYDIATMYTSDFHGDAFGGTGGNGFMKPPYAVDTAYAAMQCTDCHGAHGSRNIFNLKSSITINGTVMETGGWTTGKAGDVGFAVFTDYPLERGNDGVTQDFMQWGAWCSFCHQMESHGMDEEKTCTSGHKHGAGKM